MRKFVIALLAVFGLSLTGCQFVQQVDKIPLDKQCQLITSIARTTTYFALKESVKDTNKRIEVATKIVEVVKSIRSDSSVSLSNEFVGKFLSQYLSPDYALLLQNALDILRTYYDPKIDVAGTIGQDNVARLEAFLLGVQLGAEITVPATKSAQSPLYYDSGR